MRLVGCKRCLGISKDEPCALALFQLLLALGIGKLGLKRLITLVEFCIGLLELRTSLRVHGSLRLPMNVRAGNEKRDKQRRTLREQSFNPPVHAALFINIVESDKSPAAFGLLKDEANRYVFPVVGSLLERTVNVILPV